MKTYIGAVLVSAAMALVSSCMGQAAGDNLASAQYMSVRMPPRAEGGVEAQTILAGGEVILHTQGLAHGEVVEQSRDSDGWVIRWQGFVGDYAVSDGGLQLHFAPDGSLISLEQESVTTLPVPAHLLSAASARLAADASVGSTGIAPANDIALTARLSWWATDFSRPHQLAWVVSYASTGTTPGGAIVLDAGTGLILQSSVAA